MKTSNSPVGASSFRTKTWFSGRISQLIHHANGKLQHRVVLAKSRITLFFSPMNWQYREERAVSCEDKIKCMEAKNDRELVIRCSINSNNVNWI
jgi:hypothetical protein